MTTTTATDFDTLDLALNELARYEHALTGKTLKADRATRTMARLIKAYETRLAELEARINTVTAAVAPEAELIRARLVSCTECSRTFNLHDPADAADWAYGHDCEA